MYSTHLYMDTLDDIVNKYNKAYQRTINMKSVDVRPSIYIDFNKENNKEGPKFKPGEKIFLQNAIFKIGLKKFLLLEKLKILCHGHMLLAILTEKKLLERFTKENC